MIPLYKTIEREFSDSNCKPSTSKFAGGVRMKKRLSDFFYVLSTEVGIWIFWLIFGILWAVVCFQMGRKVGDFEPPTEADYKWLHEQEYILEQDFEKVYTIEGAQIKIEDSQIVINLISKESKDYELEITFNQKKQKLKAKEICHKEGYRTDSIYPKMEKYGKHIEFITSGGILGGVSAVVVSFLYRFLYERIKKKQQRVQ